MLKKICSWIVAIVALISLTPLLAYAVSVHSDFGVTWQKYLKGNNHQAADD
jgi:hypothetical protein